MKSIQKKKLSKDPIAEVRKDKNFSRYAKEADLRIRLAVEVYNSRKEKEITQQQLAKMVYTTQKVISNIENADVNIGLSLLHKIGESLQFESQNWSRVFNFKILTQAYSVSAEMGISNTQMESQMRKSSSQDLQYLQSYTSVYK